MTKWHGLEVRNVLIQLTMFSALFSVAFVGAYKMFPASADFPDLSQHNNVMASHLTPQVIAGPLHY
jgi:hypothetical protein